MPGMTSAAAASTMDTFDDQFCDGTLTSTNDFWSRQQDDVPHYQLEEFWSELSPQARQEVLRIDKPMMFEQARKNMFCSRCNGLLLDGFLQITTYGKSLQQEGTGSHHPCIRFQALKNQTDGDLCMADWSVDDIQDPSVHPWGGLTVTRDGMLTLLDCYLYSKSLRGLQNVFDSAQTRERERELLYPDACGGGGRGWISQGMAGCGRGHGARENCCALHTARLSVDTLVDFWSALGEETRQSLLRLKEEDFIERLMYRFDSKRFCRDCRRNVIREFKELKELKRMRRETRCTTWFCVADTAFQYEVSHDTVQADWHQTFVETFGSYHHFEWAVGTGEGKSDILEFENVGLSGKVQVKGLDLTGLNSCYITLRAWKMDGRCTELCVKAHALKGQQCVHCRLVVGDNFVTITRGENIRGFFEHAEEAEEEEDDDSMDKDGSDMDGECSRPQKHAKSPELAREFLLDAATVIFKEQVEKAFREGTARQNAHSVFVCLALKLLEERVHVAFKEIRTLEKQMKLLEEEEKEKREEEERKERRRTKEREKKLRRKERLREKEKDREKKCSLPNEHTIVADASKQELTANADEETNAIDDEDFSGKTGEATVSESLSPKEVHDEQLLNEFVPPDTHNFSDSPDVDGISITSETSAFPHQLKYTRRKLKFRKDFQHDAYSKWSDRRSYPVASENLNMASKHESRHHVDNFDTSRSISGLNKQVRCNASKPNARNAGLKFGEKFLCSCDGINERHDSYVCSCNQYNDYRAKVEMHMSRVVRDGKSESALDISKPYYRVNRNQGEYMRENPGRCKQRTSNANNASMRDPTTIKKIWEPMELQKKYHRSSSDSDVTLRSSSKGDTNKSYQVPESSTASSSDEVTGILVQTHHEDKSLLKARSDHEGFHQEEKSLQCKEATDEDNRLCSVSRSLHETLDSSMISSSNSDNCSSYLSEGDSNNFSSNPRNTESSSSSSDSEDASQNSEGRETSVCLQNGSTVCQEERKKRLSADEMDHVKSQIVNSAGIISPGSLSTKIAPSSENGRANVNLGSHPQVVLTQLHNQSVHYPIFQAPPMGYYHHSPVSWSAPPTNGYVAYSHPNHYVFASPFGYSLNGNGHFMQYGTLQHLNPPILNRSHFPAAFQPVAQKNEPIVKEQAKRAHPGVFKEVLCEENMPRVVSGGQQPNGMNLKAEARKNVKSDKGHAGNTGFSLFHFGGPVALSTGFKSGPAALKEENGVSLTLPAGAREAVEEACNEKNSVEEYNLFAAKNGIKFSFF